MKREIRLEGFSTLGGRHCQTAALRHILQYHGLSLSEPLLLGLGGGIGFIFWYMKRMPAPFTGARNGKPEDFILNICRRLGAKAELYKTSSATKGYRQLIRSLQEGSPVYAFVDMAYLEYMAMPEDAHFGAHTITVFALDEEQGTALVADRGKYPFTLGLESLKAAMSSTHPPFPAKNKLLLWTPPELIDQQILKQGIVAGIKDSCTHMLNPPIKNFGLAGIRKWAGLVVEYPRRFDEAGVFNCLLNIFVYLEIGGTGGRAFRPMYAEFLQEAAELLHLPDLNRSSFIFEDAARYWGEVVNAALPDSWNTLGRIKQLLLQKNHIFENEPQSALPKMMKINYELSSLYSQAVCEFKQAGKRGLENLLLTLQQKILRCLAVETSAFHDLAKVIGL